MNKSPANPLLRYAENAQFVLNSDGMLQHRRWLNADGSAKSGRALREELLRVRMEELSRALMRLAKDLEEFDGDIGDE